MTDAWSDRKRRSIMNLCTNCADGTTFISSKETSAVSHTSEVIFEFVDKAIEDIGPENVVQVVTDNASNNMGAKKLLEEKRPNIFWTSCAAHTINLMLQGIGNMPQYKKVVDKAKNFTIFSITTQEHWSA
jgi:type III secretory pathway lipoprotein EscJ